MFHGCMVCWFLFPNDGLDSNKPLYSFDNMFNKPIFAAAAATVVVVIVLNRNGDGINVSINFCKKDNNSHGDNNVFN